jgi:hypothetical protein
MQYQIGTAKDKIPQDNAKSDDKTVDKHDGNLGA